MTHLLPHERVCDTCGGDRKVPVVRATRSSVATEPFLATGEMVVCPDCDGVGVTVVESRDDANADLRKAIDGIDAIQRETVARLIRMIFEARDEHERDAAALRRIVRSQAVELAGLKREAVA